MSDILDALNKEADGWLKEHHTLMDWITRCEIDCSEELRQAFQDDCPNFDVIDEEPYEDELSEKIVSVYNQRHGLE